MSWIRCCGSSKISNVLNLLKSTWSTVNNTSTSTTVTDGNIAKITITGITSSSSSGVYGWSELTVTADFTDYNTLSFGGVFWSNMGGGWGATRNPAVLLDGNVVFRSASTADPASGAFSNNIDISTYTGVHTLTLRVMGFRSTTSFPNGVVGSNIELTTCELRK